MSNCQVPLAQISVDSCSNSLRSLRLAETGRRNSDVGFFPDVSKAGIDRGGFGMFVLLVQGLREAVEGPAVVGLAGEVFAIDFFGFGGAEFFEKRCAEGVANGMDPVRGLGVAEGVFDFCGFSKFRERGFDLSVAIKNLAG